MTKKQGREVSVAVPGGVRKKLIPPERAWLVDRLHGASDRMGIPKKYIWSWFLNTEYAAIAWGHLLKTSTPQAMVSFPYGEIRDAWRGPVAEAWDDLSIEDRRRYELYHRLARGDFLWLHGLIVGWLPLLFEREGFQAKRMHEIQGKLLEQEGWLAQVMDHLSHELAFTPDIPDEAGAALHPIWSTNQEGLVAEGFLDRSEAGLEIKPLWAHWIALNLHVVQAMAGSGKQPPQKGIDPYIGNRKGGLVVMVAGDLVTFNWMEGDAVGKTISRTVGIHLGSSASSAASADPGA